MKTKYLAHAALLGLNLLYTISYFVVKGVSPVVISPSAFVFIRVVGACLLFWLCSFFIKSEKIAIEDLLKLGFACLFGVVINQLSFFNGLSYTSATNTAIIMTTTPLLALPMSFFLLKEQIGIRKVLGVLIGFTGACIIILHNKIDSTATNPILGNFLIFINASSFTFYLVYMKPMMVKYHFVHLLKWLFLFGCILLIPISSSGLQELDWNFSPAIWGAIAYVIFGITFLTFMLNMFALKHLSPNVVTSYIFAQPILTAIMSFFVEGKIISWISILSSLLIFVGVYFVSFRKAKV